MRLVFKGGAVVDADVTEFSTGHHPLTGEITKLSWKSPEGARVKLSNINVDQLAAVLRVEDDSDGE